ncbi:MAG: hypothetical protein G01um101425_546 [Candidatus Peregrinibacteria bacterium Gr01-1014_25]|nr:MAG: hypothetical protein G01um101425_546 [Candidatus Peregrinibacteria bacterium Gr01-1014_25]
MLLRIGTAYAVSSWSPTLLVNTEAIQIIDDADSTANLALKFGSTINKSLTYDRTATVFRFDDDVWVNGTLSGALLFARSTLASSGTLVFEGAGSGASLYLGTSLQGVGLTDCDTEATSKLMWDATKGRFSCGADQTGGASTPEVGTSSFSGGVLRLGDSRYVNTSGDSMTGALSISVTGGSQGTLGLRVSNTASGSHVHAEQGLSSSGSLVFEGTGSGRALNLAGGNITFSNLGALVFNENGIDVDARFEGDTDANLVFFDASTDRVGIGTNAPKTKLAVVGTISGTTLATSNGISASGAVKLESSLTGATLFGFGLPSAGCSNATNDKLLWDSASGKFSCGSDQGGAGGGISYAAAEGMFVNQGGDTMTGALQVRITGGANGTLGLNVANTVSGAIVKAAKSFASSGSLSVETGQTAFNNVGYTWPTNGTNGSGLVLTLSGSSTNKLSWTPMIKRITGSSGAAGSYMTWQNLTANSADCTTTALCTAAMTTTGVGPGTWKYKYTLIYQTAATTTGIGFGIDHTGTIGQVQHMWYNVTTGGTQDTGVGDSDTSTADGQIVEGKHEGVDNTLIGSYSVGVDAANTDIMAVLEGIIVVTATGDMQLKLASEVATSAVRIMADSTLELMKIE